MKIEEFEQRLRDSVLIADGAMGSLLYETLGPQRCMDELNATRAEARLPHSHGLPEAGAHIIETKHVWSEPEQTECVGWKTVSRNSNHRASKSRAEAREAAKHEVLIAGSIARGGRSAST